MIAYKGFSKDIVSVLGNGKKECCTFEIGKRYLESECKTGRNGFHCCENPFECLSYYSLNGSNRFFKVEAGGNINEDASERIACTEITLLEELGLVQFAMEGMKYILYHPEREKWEQKKGKVEVHKDEAQACENGIAFARGIDPRVKGPEGSVLGLILEDETGIIECKFFTSNKETANRWCKLTKERKIEVLIDEEEAGREDKAD